MVTGSVDNECIVWDVPKAKGVLRLQGHTHYVQGVTWDPHGEYLTSQSGDRTVRLFASRGMGAQHQFLSARWCRHVSCQKILKSAEENPDPNAPAPAAPGDKPPRQPLFHDDTMPSFFRRPAWSPCGSFLALPAGVYRDHANAHEQHATYLYQRDRFARPALRCLAGAGWAEPQGFDVPAGFSKSKKPGRREYLRARMRDGHAEVFKSEGSGRISGLSWAEGLVELPDGAAEIGPGDTVRYIPFGSFR